MHPGQAKEFVMTDLLVEFASEEKGIRMQILIREHPRNRPGFASTPEKQFKPTQNQQNRRPE
jgi:hypothetical protein